MIAFSCPDLALNIQIPSHWQKSIKSISLTPSAIAWIILPNETLYNSTGNLPSKIDACTIEMSFTPLQTFTSSDYGSDLFHLGKIITNGVSSYNLILKAISNEGNTLRLLVGTGNNKIGRAHV